MALLVHRGLRPPDGAGHAAHCDSCGGRLERRFPYWFALAILVVLLGLRLEWAWLDDWYNLRYRTHGIAWFFALGWLIHQSEPGGNVD